jgi:flagellar protein FlaI
MIFREKWSVLITSLSSVMTELLHSGERKQDAPQEVISERERNDQSRTPHHRLREGAASVRHLPSTLGNRTDRGDILILGIFLIAGISGYIALFIDLPLVILGILGMISLSALALAASASWYRFSPVVAVSDIHALGGTISSQKDNHNRHAEKVPSAIGEDVPIPEERTPDTLDTYWIEAPYVYIKIVRQGNQGFTYTVVEPAITTREQIVLQETTNHLRKVIVYDDPDKSPVHLLSGEFIHRIIHEFYPDITDERLAILTYYLRRGLSGFGPLEALMHDPALEDISCNGDNLPVFVFHRSWGSLPASVIFRGGELHQFVLKLPQKPNKQSS